MDALEAYIVAVVVVVEYERTYEEGKDMAKLGDIWEAKRDE
jgi:hypothetical protein